MDKDNWTGPQKLYSDLIDWASPFDQVWTIDVIVTGNTVFSKLCSYLWYIHHYHAKLENNGCPVLSAFKQFHGYNQYIKHLHTAHIVTSHKLNEHCIELSKCPSYPSMTTKPHAVLSEHIQALLTCLIKYKTRLDKDNIRQQTVRTNTDKILMYGTSCSVGITFFLFLGFHVSFALTNAIQIGNYMVNA